MNSAEAKMKVQADTCTCGHGRRWHLLSWDMKRMRDEEGWCNFRYLSSTDRLCPCRVFESIADTESATTEGTSE